jgi:integrase
VFQRGNTLFLGRNFRLVVTKLENSTTHHPEKTKSGKGAYFDVTLAPHTANRAIVGSLQTHRRHQLTQNARTEKFRAVIATTSVAKVTRKLLQDFIYAMMRDRNAAATIALERSMLRVLFFHAHGTWRWEGLQDNPATVLKMPTVDNERKRILSDVEKTLLDAAIADCRNGMVGPVIELLRETAMRATEPLEKACWRDVDWTRRVLTLHDPKEGGTSEVPLSPGALQALRDLVPGAPHEPIVTISYESLRAAWNRACERAGISNLKIHDLRRTAATKMALKTGNIFLVQALTRHKSLVMVQRYVQVSADDAVNVLHAQDVPALAAPATQQPAQATQEPALQSPASATSPTPTPAPAPAPAPAMYTMEQMQTMAEVAAKAAVAHMTQAFQAQSAIQMPTPSPSPTQPLALPCDEDLIHEIEEMPVATFADEACDPIAMGGANTVALNRNNEGHLGADNPRAARSLPLHG